LAKNAEVRRCGVLQQRKRKNVGRSANNHGLGPRFRLLKRQEEGGEMGWGNVKPKTLLIKGL